MIKVSRFYRFISLFFSVQGHAVPLSESPRLARFRRFRSRELGEIIHRRFLSSAPRATRARAEICHITIRSEDAGARQNATLVRARSYPNSSSRRNRGLFMCTCFLFSFYLLLRWCLLALPPPPVSAPFYPLFLSHRPYIFIFHNFYDFFYTLEEAHGPRSFRCPLTIRRVSALFVVI